MIAPFAARRFGCLTRMGRCTLPRHAARVIVSLIAATAPLVAQPPRNGGSEDLVPGRAEQRAARQAIHDAALRGHIRFLASDLLEGRAPGSRGDLIAQHYIAGQLEALGMRPAAPGGGWLQPVPLLGVTTHAPETISLTNAARSLQLKRHDDFVISSGKAEPEAGVEDAEFVFVGYGIVAPEYDWDDFKDVDVAGKILLIMNNDPADDPDLFAGSRRLYYGRWDYKYNMAAKKGAAGAIIIHTTPSAGYPFQVVQTSWSGESFRLADASGPSLEFSGWFTEEAAKQLAELSGFDLDQLRASAQRRDFRPVPLGTRTSIQLRADVRRSTTANVLAMLPGSDPQLSKEVVIYTAHHDHLGMAAERDEQGDQIYNGAVDNASGVASMLAIAHAFSHLPQKPPRSILFAAIGAEEQGLLGSEYLAQHPPVPAGYIAAVVNIDGMNIIGPTRDVNFIGYGKSSLDAIVRRIAQWQGRVVTGDQFPDRGYYYRSDQFSLAKIGVPGVYLHSGIHVLDRPEGWGKQKLEEWIEQDYHQPSDEFSDAWDLRGAVLDVQLLFYTGLEIARQADMPQWNPGDEFEAARKEAIQKR